MFIITPSYPRRFGQSNPTPRSRFAQSITPIIEPPVSLDNYNMQIKFPTIYLLARSGENAIADVNMSLVIHLLKLTLGMVGVYETTIERKGREDYTELFESSTQDAYLSNTSPWVDKKTHTIPTYDRNTNLAVYLKSTHPSPATLHSLSWEGDANTKFYQRV